MAKLELTSNITFLYFKDLEKAKHFFLKRLGWRLRMIRAGHAFTA